MRTEGGTAETTPFLPLARDAGEATVFRCALCGARFTHGTLVCSTCPLNVGCEVVKCPECGYQFPRSSKIVNWLRRIGRRFGRARG